MAAAAGALCLLLSVSALALIIADAWVGNVLTSPLSRTTIEAVLPSGWLGFQLVRLWFVSNQALASFVRSRDGGNAVDKARLRRPFIELFVYFIATLAGLVTFALLSVTGLLGAQRGKIGSLEGLNGLRNLGLFLTFFTTSFIPLAVAFFNQAKWETKARVQPLLRDDVVSGFALVVIGIIALFLLLLALAAYSNVFSANDDFGTIITAIVIAVFIAVIITPHVARHINQGNEALDEIRATLSYNSFAPRFPPAIWASRFDSVLVRFVAPFSGATQLGWALPHTLLCVIMVLLAALGYLLASPFGLIPIVIAMTIALALGRRWAWLEEDREVASRLQTTRSSGIHIGFDNDLKDEALLGYAWLFVLVPLALNQIQDWVQPFGTVESASSGIPVVDWLRFFGAEIARAVPFVDVWETYNGDVSTPFSTTEPLAKHLVVVARMLVNVVIVSALIQAIGIWQRSRTQYKLYDAGQIDMFDPFTEADFFDRGMQSFPDRPGQPKKKFADRIREHADARKALGYAPLPYNARRLAELQNSDVPDIRDGANWMIENFGVLAGSPYDRLKQLGPRWRLFQLSSLLGDTSTSARDMVVDEKTEFERVISGLAKNSTSLHSLDIRTLLKLLVVVKDSQDFHYGRWLSYEMLGHQTSVESVLALSFHVLRKDHLIERPAWRGRTKAFNEPGDSLSFDDAALLLPKGDDRVRVYDAVGEIGMNGLTAPEARELALELLDWMGSESGDRALHARKKAADCATAIRAALQHGALQ